MFLLVFPGFSFVSNQDEEYFSAMPNLGVTLTGRFLNFEQLVPSSVPRNLQHSHPAHAVASNTLFAPCGTLSSTHSQCSGAIPFWPGSGSSQSRWRLRLWLQLQLQSCSQQFVAKKKFRKIQLLNLPGLFYSQKCTSALLCSSSTLLKGTD